MFNDPDRVEICRLQEECRSLRAANERLGAEVDRLTAALRCVVQATEIGQLPPYYRNELAKREAVVTRLQAEIERLKDQLREARSERNIAEATLEQQRKELERLKRLLAQGCVP